ncbi:MAG TPA: tetratricopeptide repeat protein [Sphingomicrobium sp.]|nr:tetratricopeptide repeat protein [Sphingomicrobium sp.]
MRVSHRFLIALGTTALLAGTAVSQRPDNQLNPLSVTFLNQGQQQLSAGKFDDASNSLESALAADPRNRAAFVVLARVAQKQKLFGKSIRLTNKALALEPNDLDALEVQGESMVELGAKVRAQANLAKLQKLCPSGCKQVAALSGAISRGPTVASVSPPATPKSN